MLLRYTNAEDKQVEVELGGQALTIGRDPQANIVVPSERASRLQCEIRQWGKDWVVKDLNSKNGTFVNEARIEVAVLKPGDRLGVGTTILEVAKAPMKGATTILREVAQEREEGKGYGTILREIVKASEKKTKA